MSAEGDSEVMGDEPESVTITFASATKQGEVLVPTTNQEGEEPIVQQVDNDSEQQFQQQQQQNYDDDPQQYDCAYDIALDFTCVPNLQQLHYQAMDQFFTFIVVPLVHPRYRRELLGGPVKDVPFTRSDMILELVRWQVQIIGKISAWLELDSDNDTERRNSELALVQELDWACHLSVRGVIIPPPSLDCCNLARCLNSYLLRPNHLQLWVHCHTRAQELGSYTAWTRIKTLCENNKKLGVVLEIDAVLPDDSELARWLGEPIRAIIINTNVFVMNSDGYPVLKKKHQNFVIELAEFTTKLILKGISKFEDGMMPYQLYLRNLLTLPSKSQQETFELPYRDYLQSPLQPLADNLESATYETFERDPIKYSQYEKAVYRALCDRFTEEQTAVVMVVGAGRGPLVRCVLRASQQAKRKVKVYAVEKNPNAIVTLQNHKINWWGDQVVVVSHDMRTWKAPEQADMLVSELLGSFGDNELEPECLDGAARFLKEGGISIPQDTMSYLSPMSSAKLWCEVNSHDKLKAFETPYVVKFHNMFELAPAQPCFYFVHPNSQSYPLPNLSIPNYPTSSSLSPSVSSSAPSSADSTLPPSSSPFTASPLSLLSSEIGEIHLDGKLEASVNTRSTTSRESSSGTDNAASAHEAKSENETRKTKKTKKTKSNKTEDGEAQDIKKSRKRVASTAQNQRGGAVPIDESSRTPYFEGCLPRGPAPPSQERVIDNNRYRRMVFKTEKEATLHGFAGYFESRLYKDVALSINPPTFSSEMFSWFPLWFPLRTPLVLPANSELEVHFWRVCTETKVWYEWATGGDHPSVLHNPGGRSSAMCL